MGGPTGGKPQDLLLEAEGETSPWSKADDVLEEWSWKL